MKRRSNTGKWVLLVGGILILAIGAFLLWRYFAPPGQSYKASDFGIATVYSSVDFNENGVDDYTDFLQGAKADGENKPTYDGRYWDTGYPPEDIGVCTDVIWRAFRQAGYSLRYMVAADIEARPEAYPRIETADDKIDFRRTVNLRSFFEAYAISLTLDPGEIDQWQPGDIVIYGDNQHVAMVSDLRNGDGVPFIIHNAGQPYREEDALTHSEITGHYRFDTSLVPDTLLIAWEG